jgi:HemY protein
MKLVVWLVLLFVVAVVAAMTLGANDGLASFYWRGWRLDLSLNFFILALLGGFIGLSTSVRLTRWLIGLPARAKAWRTERREQALQSAQRQALLELYAARYSRAVKAARRAQELAQELTEQGSKAETQAISHLLAAMSMHRLQDRAGRDEQARLAQACMDSAVASGDPGDAHACAPSAAEGLALLRAEWALDDHDAPAALAHLAQLPPGAARRIQAQRLRLQAHRLAHQPAEALKAVRQLAKHQAYKPEAAKSLIRSLAMGVLDTARDSEGLQRLWLELEREDRQDVSVLSHAVRRAAALGDAAWARRVLRLAWDTATAMIEPEWLGAVEKLAASHPREAMVQALAGAVYAERQLWGKAQPLLEHAVRSELLPSDVRRDAWCRLAQLALNKDDAQAAQHCFRQAAELD